LDSAVSMSALTKRFNDKPVVDGVSLDIPVGVAYGLRGPNGAGKTTIVRMLSTLLKPTSGTATVSEAAFSLAADLLFLGLVVWLGLRLLNSEKVVLRST